MMAPDLGSVEWFTSSRSSGNGQCCACARLADGTMALKDSKDPDGPALVFTASSWNAFIREAKRGVFDGS